MNRKQFLKTTAAGLGGLICLPACAYYPPGPYRFFTAAEAVCVIALTDQIIPADELGPGAVAAGVIYYIDRQLVRVFKKDQPVYRLGIEALQQFCQKERGKNFEDLDCAVQTDILTRIEKDEVDPTEWPDQKPQAFFRTVINHTMQGFYGSPRHGGNKDYISYRLLQFDYPQVIGQNRYGSRYGQ